MTDPRTLVFIDAIRARFPGAVVTIGPVHDAGILDECTVYVLNSPAETRVVHDVAHDLIEQIWGDDPVPVLVHAVSPENTMKYYADRLPKPVVARS